jgi:UDP-glucuronate 4-epimerase
VEAIGALTGFSPSTPLSEGVPRFVRWFEAWRAG